MLRIAFACIGILGAAAYFYFIDPSQGMMPRCPFYQVTELYCPGCGTQRGLHAFLHGNISGAIGYNPLMAFGLVYLILETGIWVLRMRGKRFRTLSSYRYTPVIVLILVVAFWIFRNIPIAPFTMLAP